MRVLDEVLVLCVKHEVDMLLVTGDIFGDRLEGKLPEIARQFLKRLHDRLQKGQVVFLLRGNHDPYNFFQLLKALLNDWATPDRVPLIIAEQMDIYRVPNKAMQVLALPHLLPSMIEKEELSPGISPEDRINILEGRLAGYINLLSTRVAPEIPAIFAGHILLRGARYNAEVNVEKGTLRELTISSRDLPGFTSYNALGHIHLSQPVSNIEKPTWYSGSPDRNDIGERDYKPQVLLITTPSQPGGSAQVTPIQLTTSTTFLSNSVSGVEAVAAFCQQVAGIDPLGILELSNIPVDLRAAVEQAIHSAAPRLDLRWAFEPAPLPGIGNIAPGADFHDVGTTVQTYLTGQYSSDPERLARLLKAFKNLSENPDSGARL
jgi:exonuclease SbcD